RRVLVRLDILHRRFIILYDGSIFIWKKSPKINLCMGIIHWYPGFPPVSLAQDFWENDPVLIFYAVFVGSSLHETVGNLIEVKFLNIVSEPACRILNRAPAAGRFLMKDLQMCGIHRVFHRLKPIAVELRLNKDFSMSILSKPHVEI